MRCKHRTCLALSHNWCAQNHYAFCSGMGNCGGANTKQTKTSSFFSASHSLGYRAMSSQGRLSQLGDKVPPSESWPKSLGDKYSRQQPQSLFVLHVWPTLFLPTPALVVSFLAPHRPDQHIYFPALLQAHPPRRVAAGGKNKKNTGCARLPPSKKG